jgi:hypothetical protein
LNIITEDELTLFLCGITEIRLEDLMQGAQYFDVEESCNLIQWFWEIIESFD